MLIISCDYLLVLNTVVRSERNFKSVKGRRRTFVNSGFLTTQQVSRPIRLDFSLTRDIGFSIRFVWDHSGSRCGGRGLFLDVPPTVQVIR